MNKRLQIGLLFMVAAVVVLPTAFFFKTAHPGLTIGIVIITMLLEIIGLGLVISSLLRNRKRGGV
ncbi:MAG: hypothetical protein REI78_11360 [Pedobacter sp.]|nr:hypothetical protein [Pedobacter sp.]MDQ8053619.1 hypothetical protein [Pedobacter sp.]